MSNKIDKAKMLDALAGNCWDLRCINESNGDDSSYCWVVVGHYMAKPYQRVLGFTNEEDRPELAVQHAINTTKKSSYDYLYEFKE